MGKSHRISTIDVHVAGEPLRIITEGFPVPQGHTILEKRRYCQAHLDHHRLALMLEPRGHSDMYGCLLVPPSHPQADYGVLFMHNEGYSTMCGHGIIGLVTVLIEQGKVPEVGPKTTVLLDTPSGLIKATALVQHGRVDSVSFQNVSSFVDSLDQVVPVPSIGAVRYDLAFGGAYYAFCQATELGLDLTPEHSQKLIGLAMKIKRAIITSRTIEHPTESDLGFLYGIIFVGSPMQVESHYRQVCVFADGALDRSPTGTGVSAHLAILAAQELVNDQTPYKMEGILGTTFTGRIIDRTRYHGRPAMITEITGQAFLTGKHEFFIDENDPIKNGFRLSD